MPKFFQVVAVLVVTCAFASATLLSHPVYRDVGVAYLVLVSVHIAFGVVFYFAELFDSARNLDMVRVGLAKTLLERVPFAIMLVSTIGGSALALGMGLWSIIAGLVTTHVALTVHYKIVIPVCRRRYGI